MNWTWCVHPGGCSLILFLSATQANTHHSRPGEGSVWAPGQLWTSGINNAGQEAAPLTTKLCTPTLRLRSPSHRCELHNPTQSGRRPGEVCAGEETCQNGLQNVVKQVQTMARALWGDVKFKIWFPHIPYVKQFGSSKHFCESAPTSCGHFVAASLWTTVTSFL